MTAVASLPPLHAPHTGGDPAAALQELRRVVEDHIANQPRTLQTRIGPSEIGNPCDHCFAARLAGWQQARDVAWLPWVGTCVHDGLERAVITHENARNAQHDGGLRYLTEHPVNVGTIGGVPVTGHVDVVDLAVGMTVDWKIVGATTLRSAKAGPSQQYRVQANLYAKGLNDAGHRIDTVAVAYLPRNAVSLDQAVWWHEPYDRQVALDALARAERLHTNLAALAAVSTQARDAWITALPRKDGCWDCARHPDHLGPVPPWPGHPTPADTFADLLAPTRA